MPCTSPDGKPTESGIATLKAIKAGSSTPSEIAATTGRQLFLVRSGLRELESAGFLESQDGKYRLTQKGSNIIT